MNQDNFLTRIKKEIQYLTTSNWKLTDIGKHWDAIIDYDEINKQTDSYFRRFTDIYKITEIPDKSYVLDICSRTGQGTLYFWKMNKIRKAMCADVSLEMQKVCNNLLSESRIKFETKLFDKLPLPFPDNEFDVVFCFETIEHFPNPEKLIKELARVAKRNAQVIITTPNVLWEPIHSLAAVSKIHHSEGPHRFISRKKLYSFIKQAGLNIIKEETTVLIPAGPKFLIKLGEWFEKKLKNTLMPYLGLRRIFVCTKQIEL